MRGRYLGSVRSLREQWGVLGNLGLHTPLKNPIQRQ